MFIVKVEMSNVKRKTMNALYLVPCPLDLVSSIHPLNASLAITIF